MSEVANEVDVLAQVAEIGKMAGYRCQRDGDILWYPFDLGGGRDQTAAVTHMGQFEDGTNVICFLSPCQRLAGGFLGGLNKKTAMNVLRTNADLPFGHFCIVEIGGEETLCVRTTQILETMEVQEFEAHCLAVVQVADAWEQRIGRNEF